MEYFDVSGLVGNGARRLSKKIKVMIVLNTAWNLINFRAGLIRALVSSGYEVVAVAPFDEYAQRLESFGCRFIALPMDNKGTHPGRDVLLFIRFLKLLHKERPDVFLGYTIKPNIYGSLAAHMLGIRVINNIAGLGAVFIKNNWLTRFVKFLYKSALSRSNHVFFQNNEDMTMFVEQRIVDTHKVSRLPGSGINLDEFCFTPKQIKRKSTFSFLLVARLLWDKGVGEYVDAASILHHKYPDVKFKILGFLDVKNPSAVTSEQMDMWVKSGIVEYLGASDDVKPYLIAADCVVLPSYREGVPRSLLEAAAIGRPIITTDVIGCRDAVDDSINGLLCCVRDSKDLAKKMQLVIEMTPNDRNLMGIAGRKKVEREFDEDIVIKEYLNIIAGNVSSQKISIS